MLVLALFFLVRLAAAQDTAYPDALLGKASELRLASDPGWLALGHYRKTRLGRLESQADGPRFFLSPQGKTDPKAELDAALLELFRQRKEDEGVSCRFPARARFLRERLAIDASLLPAADCPRLEEWLRQIDGAGLTLVFADAFLDNPASMYGHTFLRVRRRSAQAGSDLLDYTINFAGTPDTRNSMLYALRGLSGGFPGKYSTQPYYMKTQEYANLESRDLWEYDLDLSSAAMERFLLHAWEIGGTHFDYFFFSENCSYQLLTLLDAAEPSLALASLFGFGVIPADTVRAVLSRPGLVKARRYRPSFATELKARRARLKPAEFSAATRLGRGAAPDALPGFDAFPADRRALILDSAHDLLRFRAGFTSAVSSEALRLERKLLLARGRLGQPPLPADIKEPAALEEGHRSARAGLGAGVTGGSSFAELQFRPALHDLASRPDGYIAGSQLEMMDLALRIDHRGRQAYVERLDLVDIVSLSPWDSWLKRPSWKVSTGVDQAKELGCSGASCMYYRLNAGFGLSAQVLAGRRAQTGYLFAEADSGAGPVLRRGWRLGGGGTAGLLLDVSSWWRVQFEAGYLAYGPGNEDRRRLRLVNVLPLSRDLELRLVFDQWTPAREAGLSLLAAF